MSLLERLKNASKYKFATGTKWWEIFDITEERSKEIVRLVERCVKKCQYTSEARIAEEFAKELKNDNEAAFAFGVFMLIKGLDIGRRMAPVYIPICIPFDEDEEGVSM